MSNPRQTLSFLRRRMTEVGIEPDKKHGQNFLIDMNLLDMLVERADIQPWDVVLEVGTGMGSLTGLMAPHAAHVISVEIDPRMYQLASEELIDHQNITLLNCDALKNKNHLSDEVLDQVRQQLSVDPRRRFKVAANLPYCAATPIISNLLIQAPFPVSMTVTIQKELADRIVAQPGCKDFSALSVWMQCQCRTEIVRELAPTVFWPRPRVTSAILHVEFDPELRARISDVDWFHDFTRQLFLYRRKYLRGVLITVLKGKLNKHDIDVLLAELGWNDNIRAEELPVSSLILLADQVQRRLANLTQS